MLKLATVLDNPGEPFAQTRYRDPLLLKQLGYTGLVLYETTGLSGVESPQQVGAGEMGRWVASQFDAVRTRIEAARKAGLDVYILFDVLSLARATVEKHVAQLTCRNRPTSLCPASEAALERSGVALQRLLEALPPVEGVVLRLGDNDAARLPYLVGNDLYLPHCPRCSQLGRADRLTLAIDQFHKIVVGQLGKRLIVRAWNLRPNGMHDLVDLCRRVCQRLPGSETDDRLVISFKFTQTDFWRYQRWNPSSLACGKRPVMYELQCQREFEGKGGIPNWQVPLWCNPPEPPEVSPTDALEGTDGAPVGGLSRVVNHINFAGLWAWVRGGGWGGPFVSNETWIDANAFAVPPLVDNPQARPAELARQWIARRLGQHDPAVADALAQTLAASPSLILQGFYLGPLARAKKDPWHPNADWIQDDLVDAAAAWRIIQRLPDGDLDAVIQEKQQAVAAASRMQASLAPFLQTPHRAALEPLCNSLVYAESLFQALRDLLAGLVAYRRYLKSRSADLAELCRDRLTSAQSHWTNHAQRHGSLPGAATAFREAHFWDLTQKILGELP